MSHRKTPRPQNTPHTDRYGGGLRGLSREFADLQQGSEPNPPDAAASGPVHGFENQSRARVFRKINFLNFLVTTSASLQKESGQRLGGVRQRHAVYAEASELAQFNPNALLGVIGDYDRLQTARLGTAAKISVRAQVSLCMPGDHQFDANDRLVVMAKLPMGNNTYSRRVHDERNQLRTGVLGLEPRDGPWEIPIACSEAQPNNEFVEAARRLFPCDALVSLNLAETFLEAPGQEPLHAGLWLPGPTQRPS